MKRLDLKRHEVDTDAWWRKVAASDSHFSVVIDEPFLGFEGDELRVVYLHVDPEKTAALRTAVQTIRYEKGYRTVGLKSCSRVFGFQPRLTIRRDFCSAAGLSLESPREHDAIVQGGERASELFKQFHPAQFQAQSDILKAKVRPEWTLPGGVFTSGIVNYNNELRYHFDAGNFPNCWSGMYVFSSDVRGGSLSLPEFKIAVELRNSSLIFFNGATVFHGVTPIHKKSLRGARYSIVYYALRDMCKCLSAAEELERIRQVKTQREIKRSKK